MHCRVRVSIDFVTYMNGAGVLFDTNKCCDVPGSTDNCNVDPCDYVFTACLDDS